MRKLFFSLLLFMLVIVRFNGQEPLDRARQFYGKYKEAWNQGDFNSAVSFLKRILESEAELPVYNQALVHNSLGLSYYELGSFEEAVDQYQMASQLCTDSQPATKKLRISIVNNQAMLFTWIGDYATALIHYDRALLLLDSVPRRDMDYYSKLSMLLFNKGIVYYKLGMLSESMELLKASQQIKERFQQPYLGGVYFNLARVSQMLGSVEPTEHYYRLAINRWISEYDSGYYELANIYLNYGQFLADLGDRMQGLEYLQMAQQNYLANYGSRHPLVAGGYEKLAAFHLEQSDVQMALKYLEQGIQSVTSPQTSRVVGSGPDIEYSTHDLTLLRLLALKAKALNLKAGQEGTRERKMEILNMAAETNQHSIEVLHRIQNSYISRESRLYLTSRQKDLFTTGIRLNMQMHELTGLETYREQAFLMAANGKSNELIYEMKTKEWLFLESLPDSLAQQALDLKEKADRLNNMIQSERQELYPDSLKLTGWQDQLFYTTDSLQLHLEKIREQYPQINHFESVYDQLSVKQIRKKLKRNESMVEYFISGDDHRNPQELFVFVLTRKSCQVYCAPIEPDFSKNMAFLVNSFHDHDPFMDPSFLYDSTRQALFDLYQQLVHPIETYLQGPELIIVPDEELALIPFDALITRYDPEGPVNYAGLPYLLHLYHISYLYNSRLLTNHVLQKWRFPEVSAWLPDYSTSDSVRYSSLEGATREVEAVIKIAGGHRFNKTPDKPAAMKLLQQHNIIHMAMHALAEDHQTGSPYFIVDSKNDSMHSNHLYDYEINALSLTTPMVVLSSCETASGTLQHGEGIMSLSRSFLQAGAASVVHSLWPVEDEKGSELMVNFYKELKRGTSKSQALTDAKKDYLSGQPPVYTHPYYWATFQITGEPAALIMKPIYKGLRGLFLVLLLGTGYLMWRSSFRRD